MKGSASYNSINNWKPINKQAAFIMRPAKEISLPPVEYTPNFYKLQAEKREVENKRCDYIKKSTAQADLERKAKQKEDSKREKERSKQKKLESPRNSWLKKYLRKEAKKKGETLSKTEIKEKSLKFKNI